MANPVINQPGNSTIYTGFRAVINTKAEDADEDVLTYSVVGTPLPTGLTLDTATGLISGTAEAAGTTNVTIEVTDGTNTDSATFDITVLDGSQYSTVCFAGSNFLVKYDEARNANVLVMNSLTPIGGGSSVSTFEYVSQNIDSYPYTLSYSSGRLSTVTYTTGSGTIVKTLNYTGDKLTSVVLSGSLPAGLVINTKTLTYTGDDLTSVAYS